MFFFCTFIKRHQRATFLRWRHRHLGNILNEQPLRRVTPCGKYLKLFLKRAPVKADKSRLIGGKKVSTWLFWTLEYQLLWAAQPFEVIMLTRVQNFSCIYSFIFKGGDLQCHWNFDQHFFQGRQVIIQCKHFCAVNILRWDILLFQHVMCNNATIGPLLAWKGTEQCTHKIGIYICSHFWKTVGRPNFLHSLTEQDHRSWLLILSWLVFVPVRYLKGRFSSKNEIRCFWWQCHHSTLSALDKYA